MTRAEYLRNYHRTYGKLPHRRAYLTQKQREYRADPMRGGNPDGRAGAIRWMVAQIVWART